MIDNRARGKHAAPAAPLQPKTKVDVFVIAFERFVEQTNLCKRRAAIEGGEYAGGETEVAIVANQSNRGPMASQVIDASVSGVIIDDDYVKVGPRLTAKRAHQRRQEALPVEVGDNDGCGGRHVGQFSGDSRWA